MGAAEIFLFGILAASFVVPFFFLQFMPGKASLFVATSALLIFCAWNFQTLQDYEDDDRMGIGSFIGQSILIATLLGVTFRTIVLLRRNKARNKKIDWSWKDGTIVGILIAVLLFSQILGSSGVCVSEGHKLSDDELINHYLVGNDWKKMSAEERDMQITKKRKKFSGYYWISGADKSLFGSFRVTLRKVIRDDNYPDSGNYIDTTVLLNACGHPVTKNLTMTHNPKEYEHFVDRQSKYYKWIE